MAELDKTISVIESWLKQPVLTPPPINELYDALELMKEQKANTPSAGEIAEEMVNYICEHEKVVRCKDCAYLNRDPRFMNYGYCSYFKDEFYAKVKPDKNFYCGAGKRSVK